MRFLFRKTTGLFFISIGLGMLLVLFLPEWGWILGVGVVLLVIGLMWMFC